MFGEKISNTDSKFGHKISQKAVIFQGHLGGSRGPKTAKRLAARLAAGPAPRTYAYRLRGRSPAREKINSRAAALTITST